MAKSKDSASRGIPPNLPSALKKQLKFYRYLVVVPEGMIVVPAKDEEEAFELAKYNAPGAFIVDARWNDDSDLFWSGTEMGYSLELPW